MNFWEYHFFFIGQVVNSMHFKSKLLGVHFMLINLLSVCIFYLAKLISACFFSANLLFYFSKIIVSVHFKCKRLEVTSYILF